MNSTTTDLAARRGVSATSMAALTFCLVLWPLFAAHGFPRTVFADPDGPFATGLLGPAVSLVLIAMPTLAAIAATRVDRIALEALGGSARLRPYAIAGAIMLIAAFTMIVLRGNGLWSPPATPGYAASDAGAMERSIKVFLRLIQVGGEEFVFRGFAIAGLIAVTGNKWLSVVIASAAFAYAHLGSFGRPALISEILLIFVLAVGLSALRLRPGGLWTAILIHWGWLAWLTTST